MGESMDIVQYLDQLDGAPIFAPSANRQALTDWLNSVNTLLKLLLYPRWLKSPIAEFETQSARDYFQHKKEKDIGLFAEALEKSGVYQAELEAQLLALEPLLHSTTSVNQTLSIDDVDLFGRLRAITLIKDLVIPAKTRAYIDHFAAVTNIPLYDNIAI